MINRKIKLIQKYNRVSLGRRYRRKWLRSNSKAEFTFTEKYAKPISRFLDEWAKLLMADYDKPTNIEQVTSIVSPPPLPPFDKVPMFFSNPRLSGILPEMMDPEKYAVQPQIWPTSVDRTSAGCIITFDIANPDNKQG